MELPSHLSIDRLRDMVQDASVNVLIGAGASAELLSPLGNIEEWLTYLGAETAPDDEAAQRVRASVYGHFFSRVIAPNTGALDGANAAEEALETYRLFLRTLNTLLVQRRSSILDKQVNLFTTNVDILIELAAEQLRIELNDGFAGSFKPAFDSGNFGSVKYRRSLQYDNLAEVPTFNLFKMHGSVSWSMEQTSDELGSRIGLDSGLRLIREIAEKADAAADVFYELERASVMSEVLDGASPPTAPDGARIQEFTQLYETLAIVNPTKDKFRDTVLNQNYYDLLRIFSNSLEKDNCLLFIVGFSCRDEHIRSLIIRSARTNPTLQVIVFAYSPNEVGELQERLGSADAPNGNILVVGPPVEDGQDQGMRFTLREVTSRYFAPLIPKPPRRPDSVVDLRVSLTDPAEVEVERR